MKEAFATEAELVQCFLENLNHRFGPGKDWTVYPETAGWDLLLVHTDGFQLGLEAKLTLNAKVIAQALSGTSSYWQSRGPDYRGVLVPAGGKQAHIEEICTAVGLGLITMRKSRHGERHYMSLPTERTSHGESWPNWLPSERCKLPEYMPDVPAGVPSPVQLTDWKIKAIRLMILLERRGYVTRDDMKRIGISPTRWTDRFHGFLRPGEKGYVRCERTPDVKAQHPTVWAKIEAEIQQWVNAMGLSLGGDEQGVLI